MYAYAEAFRNSDFEAMRPLLTADMKGSVPDDDSEVSIEVRHEADGIVEATDEEEIRQLEPLLIALFREMQSQALAVNGEYVGDEFHFLLRMPAPPAPKIPDSEEQGVEISVSVTPPPDTLIKMRKEEGIWQVYEREILN